MNKHLKAKIIAVFGTQADFAQKIKETEPVVSRVVRNRKTLSLERQKAWAKVLKSDPKQLFNCGEVI